ncbi:MAG: hypothetical protein U0984_05545 [Prosthecobacter sp.]|nr:hypothetical protein [Prosthecobacter sp.]
MKNFIALLIFAAIFGYAGWRYYSRDTVSWIKNVSEQTTALENKILTQKAELTAITSALELQKKANASRQALAIINARQKNLATEKSALLKERQKTLSGSRQSLVGVVLTDVTLADGRKLDKARIIKVDDGGVSMAVASGVLRVTPKELTPELRSYFSYP